MNKHFRRIVLSLILLLINGTAMYVFSHYPSIFFPAYRNCSKWWMTVLSTITGSVPFSVWDIILLVLITGSLIGLIHCLKTRQLLRWFCDVLLIISILATSVISGWMLNHYAPSLSSEIGLTLQQSSVDELYEACSYYLDQAVYFSRQIPRDENGHMEKLDFEQTAVLAGKSYHFLGESYPVFKGSEARVKRFTLLGEYLMYNGIIGMFMPVTGESSVPASVPDAVLPFTMAHEAAHRLGFASEQEANCAAFLACISSQEVIFLYSGYYEAFSYCYNQLYRADSEKALSLFQNREDTVLFLIDKQDTRAVYARYESPMQDISDKINDTYLKSFGQESGVRSYGEVVDYLIAYYQNPILESSEK